MNYIRCTACGLSRPNDGSQQCPCGSFLSYAYTLNTLTGDVDADDPFASGIVSRGAVVFGPVANTGHISGGGAGYSGPMVGGFTTVHSPYVDITALFDPSPAPVGNTPPPVEEPKKQETWRDRPPLL